MFYFFTNLCSCHLEIEKPIRLQLHVSHTFLLVMVVYPMVLDVACSGGNSSGVGTAIDVLTELNIRKYSDIVGILGISRSCCDSETFGNIEKYLFPSERETPPRRFVVGCASVSPPAAVAFVGFFLAISLRMLVFTRTLPFGYPPTVK